MDTLPDDYAFNGRVPGGKGTWVTLRGGPHDGQRRLIHAIAPKTEIATECPWMEHGDRWHLAGAQYRQDGTWVETRCVLVPEGDEPLIDRPDEDKGD